MTATATEFLVSHTLDAYEHDERVYARTWTLRSPGTGFDGRSATPPPGPVRPRARSARRRPPPRHGPTPVTTHPERDGALGAAVGAARAAGLRVGEGREVGGGEGIKGGGGEGRGGGGGGERGRGGKERGEGGEKGEG